MASRRPSRHLLSLIAALTITFAVSLPAQQASQRTDPEFARLVKEWTTSPEFLSPLVDHLPLADGIPTTKDVLGYYVGQPKTLTHTADAIRYYRALEAKSPRVKVLSIGKTDEGREQVIVFVANDDTIKRLEEYRGYLAKIADPRGISDAEMKAVIAKAKPIYHFSGGLHSAETGPPEMLMELAYRLAAGESDLIRQIRDNVIVSITPAADPDGRDRYVDWYYQHLIDIDNERDRISGPPYWGKYIYHDNNRDINYSQATMKNTLDWYLQWHPPIWHDLHESVPFMYTFSGQAPQNPTLDPILYGEMPWFANFEMAQMIKYGMPGVWTHGFVDMWSPGYLAFAASNHNGMIRMYETFGNGGATTMKRTVANPEFPGAANQTTREWYRPLPPYKEVTWSMRNNTNYMETGVLSALQLASSFPKVILENYYQKTLNSISQGEKSAPHAYIIPGGQRDRTRIAMLVNLLRVQGIEIGQVASELKLSDGTYPAGSYVIKQNQPYGRLAKILLEKQDFPDQNLRTYDDTGWTMGLMLQAEVKTTADKAVLAASTTTVDKVVLTGTVAQAAAGKAAAYIVPNTGSNSMITLRFRLKDFYVKANDAPFKVGDREIPAGSFVISATQPARPPTKMAMDGTAGLTKAIETLGLDAIGVDAMPTVAMHDVDVPRVAIYSTWGNTQEVGWVRHAFDQFETPFDLIYKERVRKGNLRANYDVIVVPNQGRSGKGLVYDIESKGKPIAYKKDPKFPTLGMYGESDDITGGMGLEGVVEFQKFVNDGGVLVTLATASFLPTEFGITKNVNASRPSPQFYAPGPIIEAEILNAAHPIFYGYTGKKVPVRYGNGPLLQVPAADSGQILMRYPGGDAAVLSGLMKGANEVRNRPAIVDVPTGKGRVVLFAGNPCYRWQNHGEFGMLFNAILHWNDMPAPAERPAATTTPTAGM